MYATQTADKITDPYGYATQTLGYNYPRFEYIAEKSTWKLIFRQTYFVNRAFAIWRTFAMLATFGNGFLKRKESAVV